MDPQGPPLRSSQRGQGGVLCASESRALNCLKIDAWFCYCKWFSCKTWLFSSWGHQHIRSASFQSTAAILSFSGAVSNSPPAILWSQHRKQPQLLGWLKKRYPWSLSNCTWHMVLRCAREDGWQSTTLLWFFCLLPLSSMKIARDINAEEPEKKRNGKTEREKQALPTQHTAFRVNWFAQTQETTQTSCAAAAAPVPWIITVIQKKACD